MEISRSSVNEPAGIAERLGISGSQGGRFRAPSAKVTSRRPPATVCCMKCDVIIIGGGVLGLSLAYHLSHAPTHGSTAKRVLVLEREQLLGMHASGKNAGMFRKLYRHPELTEWADRSSQLWPRALREQCFRTTGSFIASRHLPAHHPELFAERTVTVDRGESLTGVFCASDGLLDSPLYLSVLRSLIDRERVDLRLGDAVTGAERNGQEWVVETAAGLRAQAPWLVNASGAWLNSILAPSLSLDALPYARHLFLVDGWPAGYMPLADVGFYWDEREGWYVRQWDAHTRLVSSCDRIASVPETFAPPPELVESLAQTLTEALPHVSQTLGVKRHWHCFRTYVPDQLPVWGEDPRAPGLFWLGAFGGFGMSTSFAAAADAAAVLLGRGMRIRPDFSPLRVLCDAPPHHSADRVAA